MNPKFKITIPKPCNENWDKMTPDETGRFCLVCNKSVIDFSNKLPDEIQHFFIKNQGQKICGRFKNSQLDSISIQIPSQVVFSQTQYHKMFLLALFVVMGTSLFSCATIHGGKQKIEKIEVVEFNKNHASIDSTFEIKTNNTSFIKGDSAGEFEMIFESNEKTEETINENDIIKRIEQGDINLPTSPELQHQIESAGCMPQLIFEKESLKNNEHSSKTLIDNDDNEITMGTFSNQNIGFSRLELTEKIESVKNNNTVRSISKNDCKPELVMGLMSYYPISHFNLPILTLIKCDNMQITFSAYKPVIEEDIKYLNKNTSSKKESGETDRQAIKIDPNFLGGIEQFCLFFANELQIPKNTDLNNQIIFSFTIEKDGSLTPIKVDKIKGYMSEEVIRVLTSSPKWKPGEYNGEKIKMKYFFTLKMREITLN